MCRGYLRSNCYRARKLPASAIVLHIQVPYCLSYDDDVRSDQYDYYDRHDTNHVDRHKCHRDVSILYSIWARCMLNPS